MRVILTSDFMNIRPWLSQERRNEVNSMSEECGGRRTMEEEATTAVLVEEVDPGEAFDPTKVA